MCEERSWMSYLRAVRPDVMERGRKMRERRHAYDFICPCKYMYDCIDRGNLKSKVYHVSNVQINFWICDWVYIYWLPYIQYTYQATSSTQRFHKLRLQHTTSRPIIPINRNILMTKITKPITTLLPPHPTPSPPQIH